MSFTQRFNIAAALEQVSSECDPAEVFEDNIDEGLEIQELQESIEFSVDEIGKGLEGIVDLIGLSNKLEKNEGDGIAIENYSDLAQIAYSSILRRIGLEDGEVFDKDDSTGKDVKDITPKPSGKVRQMVEKIIEVIKRIWEKAVEYFKKAYEYVTNKFDRAIRILNDLNDSAKIAALKAGNIPNFEIENPRYFQDKKLVSAEDIFGYSGFDYLKSYSENITKFEEEAKSTINLVPEDIGDKPNKLLNNLKGIKKNGRDKYVTPEGYIDVQQGQDIGKIVFQKEIPDNPVEKQTFAQIAKMPEIISLRISNLESARKSSDRYFEDLEKKINNVIPNQLKSIQQQLKNAEDTQKVILLDAAKKIKNMLDYASSLRNTSLGYTNDLVGMIMYYSYHINQAVDKAKNATTA